MATSVNDSSGNLNLDALFGPNGVFPDATEVQIAQATKLRNAQGLAAATQFAPGLSNPLYSMNPADAFRDPNYTNRYGLGPEGQVSINQGTPTDLGWSTGSAYDPNTGLSKWSSSGLTNGEAYYGNLYAPLRAAEEQRKAAAAASRAAMKARGATSRERQLLRNQVVDSLVAGGQDKSMARVAAKNLSDADLFSKVQEIEDYAAKAPQRTEDQRLNDMISQFSDPNYGASPGSTQPPQGQGTNAAPGGTQPPANNYSGATGNANDEYQQIVNQQQRQLSQEYQQKQDTANAANEARYQDSIAGYQQNQQNISNYLTNQGQQQQEDIGNQYDQFGARNEQDLITRGLGNTTVRSATQRGIEEDRGRALRNSQEQIDGQRLNYETQAQRDLLGFMERRTDQGPDYNQLIGLQQGLGNAGGGASGGYGGGPYNDGSNMAGAGGQTGTGYTPPAGQQPQYGGGYGGSYGQGLAGMGGGYQAPNSTGTEQAPPGSNNARQAEYANFANLSELDQDRWRTQIQGGNKTWEDFTSGGQAYDQTPVGVQNESYTDRMFREQREQAETGRANQQAARDRQSAYRQQQQVANRSPEMQAIYDRSNAAITQQQSQGYQQPGMRGQPSYGGTQPHVGGLVNGGYQPIYGGGQQQPQQPQQPQQYSGSMYQGQPGIGGGGGSQGTYTPPVSYGKKASTYQQGVQPPKPYQPGVTKQSTNPMGSLW